MTYYDLVAGVLAVMPDILLALCTGWIGNVSSWLHR